MQCLLGFLVAAMAVSSSSATFFFYKSYSPRGVCKGVNCWVGSVCIPTYAWFGKYIGKCYLNKRDRCPYNGCPSGQICVVKSCKRQCIVDTSSPSNPCEYNPCYNGGTCTADGSDYTCRCKLGFKGNRCEIKSTYSDNCSTWPCKNGGRCYDGINSFVCDCSGTGYGGPTCEDKRSGSIKDICNSKKCLWGFLCIPYFTGSGYEPKCCLINILKCPYKPCPSGQVCVLQGLSRVCINDPTPIVDPCDPDPCQNGGTCYPDGDGFRCKCRDGYEGKICNIDTDECKDNGACGQNGVCVDQVNGFSCSCEAGYTGDRCNENIDDCKDNEFCLNGGTCIDGVNSYTCNCQPGFTGEFCEIEIDECASSPCQNQGTCVDKVNRYECICVEYFKGNNCEIVPTYLCDPNPCCNDKCHVTIECCNGRCWAAAECIPRDGGKPYKPS